MKLEGVDERQIIERVLRGDTNAFNLLVWQWERAIYKYINRMIGDRDEAMDLCPESFMKTLQQLATLKEKDHFPAWLYRIAHNTCYSRLRRDRTRRNVALDPNTGATRTPVDERLAVEKALGSLPEEQKEVVIPKVFHDLKFEEIAAVQNAPV